VTAGSDNARLKVSFFGPVFFGDYRVLDRAEDYFWSIVAEPSGRYLWLLGRSARPSEAARAAITARAGALGYDTSRLRITRQNWPAGPEGLSSVLGCATLMGKARLGGATRPVLRRGRRLGRRECALSGPPIPGGAFRYDRFRFPEPALVAARRMMGVKGTSMPITPEHILAAATLVTALSGLVWAFRRRR
jgi:hypothetical protein